MKRFIQVTRRGKKIVINLDIIDHISEANGRCFIYCYDDEKIEVDETLDAICEKLDEVLC